MSLGFFGWKIIGDCVGNYEFAKQHQMLHCIKMDEVLSNEKITNTSI